MNHNKGIGTIVIIAGVILAVLASPLSSSAKAFPFFTGVGMVVLGVWFFLEHTTDGKTAENAEARWYPVWVIVYCVLFILFLEYLAFEIATFLLMVAIMLLFGFRVALRLWYLPLVVPIILVIVFAWGLQVRLPSILFGQ